jgi:probable F420-dependent oxidoreductase
VGVLLQPQHSTYAAYAQAVRQVESIGVDTLWDWDHFFPPYAKRRRGKHFEGWTLLTAMAMLTTRAEVGCLVTCNSYRNPTLLANMAKTVDHISGGRLILGIGAGWFEREYREYGYSFGTARERLEALGQALPLIRQRWQTELPPPVRNPIPILIGGEGEQITLKLAAQHANIWNGFSPPEHFKHKCEMLDNRCAEVECDPAEIERSVLAVSYTAAKLDQFLEAGASHVIIHLGEPWNFVAVEKLVRWRDSRR